MSACPVDYLRKIVVGKPKNPTDKPKYRPFLLDDDSRQKPTVLSLTYYVDDVCYLYKVSVSAERVEEEELRLVAGKGWSPSRWIKDSALGLVLLCRESP